MQQLLTTRMYAIMAAPQGEVAGRTLPVDLAGIRVIQQVFTYTIFILLCAYAPIRDNVFSIFYSL